MKKAKEAAAFVSGFGIIVLFLFISGIGCPIRFVTGISCPGCGITRALWAALHFQFGLAFYYHPLFWVAPLLFVSFFFWEYIPGKAQTIFLCMLIAAYLIVYLLRLIDRNCTIVTADIGSSCVAVIFDKIRQCFV